MDYLYAVTAAAGLIAGFVGGLVTFKRSLRWCPGCGATLRCLECAGQPTPRHVREPLRAGGQP